MKFVIKDTALEKNVIMETGIFNKALMMADTAFVTADVIFTKNVVMA